MLVFFALVCGTVFPTNHIPTAKADIFDNAFSTVSSGFDYIWPDGVQFKDFKYRLGLGVGMTPDYSGSNDYSLRVVPLIDVRFKNRWTLQGSKLRVNVLSNEVLKLGPLINYRFGRGESNNLALTGLGNVSGTMQVGAFAELQTGLLLASAEVRQAVGSGHGAEAIFIVGNGLYRDENWLVVMGLRGVWSSGKQTQAYYGVNETQALASGYEVSKMSSGFNDVGLNFIVRYQLNDSARIENIVGVSKIIGSAASSPIVKLKGSTNQVIFGVGFRYSF